MEASFLSIISFWPWKVVNSTSGSACLVPGLSEFWILVNQVVVVSAGEVWVVAEVELEVVEKVEVEVGLEMWVGGCPSLQKAGGGVAILKL